jgi:hypothetical protein
MQMFLAHYEYHLRMSLEGMLKTINNINLNSRFSGWGLNPGLIEYEAGVLPTGPQRFVEHLKEARCGGVRAWVNSPGTENPSVARYCKYIEKYSEFLDLLRYYHEWPLYTVNLRPILILFSIECLGLLIDIFLLFGWNFVGISHLPHPLLFWPLFVWFLW